MKYLYFISAVFQVLHSQKLREKALRPWIVAEKDGNIVASHCNCQAGLGEVCTHVSAMLFSIEAVVRIRDARTVTEKPAYWKLPAEMKKIEYNMVYEMDMTSAKSLKRKLDDCIDATSSVPVTPKPQLQVSSVQAPTENELNEFYEELFKTGTKPVVLSTIQPYCDSYVPRVITEEFPKMLSDFYQPKLLEASLEEVMKECASLKSKLAVTEEQVKNVEEATRQQYKTKLWNKFRSGRVTASKARAVCKTNPKSPAPSLIKAICYPETMNFTSAATKWGCDHEQTAKTEFYDQMEPFHENLQINSCGFFIDPKNMFMGASPDATVSCDCCGTFLLEIKCPYCVKDRSVYDKDIAYLEKSDDGRFNLKKDHPYYYQVQTQMGVTGTPMSFFVVWSSKDMHVERIFFDDQFYEDICSKANVVFETAILPEIVGKCTTKRLLKPLSDNVSIPIQNACGQTTSEVAHQSANVITETLWCHCRKGEYGKMVACDNENCCTVWFHLECVGLRRAPKGKWFCRDCAPQFINNGKK